jgi:hypothetical protein
VGHSRRRRHGEIEGVEAKAAHAGTPGDLFKPLSASPTASAVASLLFRLGEWPALVFTDRRTAFLVTFLSLQVVGVHISSFRII